MFVDISDNLFESNFVEWFMGNKRTKKNDQEYLYEKHELDKIVTLSVIDIFLM